MKTDRSLLIKKIIIGLTATFLFVYATSAAPVNQGRIHIQQKTFALEGDSVFIEYEKAADYFAKAHGAGNTEASNNIAEIEKTK